MFREFREVKEVRELKEDKRAPAAAPARTVELPDMKAIENMTRAQLFELSK